MSPSRSPPGDAISRCRDAVDSIQAATSHKYARDRAELVHLLGSPHIQVSEIFLVNYWRGINGKISNANASWNQFRQKFSSVYRHCSDSIIHLFKPIRKFM